LFDGLKVREIGRSFWLYLLRYRHESIHYAVGEANNLLLTDVFSGQTNKNTSLIIIAFEAVGRCLES